MLRFKPEVRIIYFDKRLSDVLAHCTLWSLRTRIDVEVNAIDERPSQHSPTTLHGQSLAIDLDTVDDRRADTEALADYLRRQLSPQYDVLFEGDHVHVEWDARRGPLRKAVMG